MAEADAAVPWRTAIDALRARGVAGRDPVRFRFAVALARRAAAHEGAARRVIDAKLTVLVATLGEDASPASVDAGEAPPITGPTRRPLAELLDHLARQKAAAAGPDALQTLAFFRRTWARLSAEQRIAQSRSALPANAGPLHSQHVVHRSLTLMRALSPAYFERFTGYVDALLWLEDTGRSAVGVAGPAAARGGAPRKSTPRRRPG